MPDDIPPQMKILNMVIPILMHFLQFHLELERCKLHNAALHSTKCSMINDVKMFPAVYRSIYCPKLLTLSNQMTRYKSKYIRIVPTQQTTENEYFFLISPYKLLGCEGISFFFPFPHM